MQDLSKVKKVFFIGVAGTGMSALAQYLKGIGKDVSGSDRYFTSGSFNEIKDKLEKEDIKCFPQDCTGIDKSINLVVVSTAIEDTVPEVQKAKELNIPIIKRSELLAMIATTKKTIAIGGTSGKSTTTAMLFDILEYAKMDPSIIGGAGLTSLIKKGKIGNAKVGQGEWLVIEADESDGSIVGYKSEIGVLLNIDKDHKNIEGLTEIFTTFKNNSKKFVVNQSHFLARQLSQDIKNDFSVNEKHRARYFAQDFKQDGFNISFQVDKILFSIAVIGKHNMENALAAISVAHSIGVSLETASEALKNYEGIYRRHQVYGNKNGVWLVDDFAHNPTKCRASIEACQAVAPKVIAWFQPHGYTPTKFLREDFISEISKALRPDDEIWMSEIYYAGGTATKDISANDLINDLMTKGVNAFFVADRNDFLNQARPHLSSNCVLLLMGARDPSLEEFAKSTWESL